MTNLNSTMKISHITVLLITIVLQAAAADNAVMKENGIIDIPSNHSVDQTMERLKSILQSKEVTVFALIDHSGEAEKVGMKMRPTKLLIFGSPKAGTPPLLVLPSTSLLRS
jgi:uncharacterized protein (DUF302 family)